MNEKKEEKDLASPIDPFKAPFGQTNFDFLYDSFHQPLTDVITGEGVGGEGGIIGLNKKGELRHFEHTTQTREAEKELCKYAKGRDIEMLDLKLSHYYNDSRGTMDDIFKYILCFYKVFFYYVLGRC